MCSRDSKAKVKVKLTYADKTLWLDSRSQFAKVETINAWTLKSPKGSFTSSARKRIVTAGWRSRKLSLSLSLYSTARSSPPLQKNHRSNVTLKPVLPKNLPLDTHGRMEPARRHGVKVPIGS